MKELSLKKTIIFLLVLGYHLTGHSQMPELNNIYWRCIGPAHFGGRVPIVAGVPGDHKVYFIGTAAGGLYRTSNGGITFESVFDQVGSQSIGAIAIANSDSKVLYVGTGEGDPRNDISYGDGIYRSNNGGNTWLPLGLKNTERFSEIAIHPKNPEIVYAAAMGTAWSPNEERGIFRSTNGGETWKRVLFVNNTTGASSVCINPQNPDIIYAGMYDYLRQPWHFRSGGPGSGLYRSHDGGDTWELLTNPQLKNGLPGKKILGRIDINISPSDPEIIYSMIESQEEGELWRSDDGGEAWQMVNGKREINNRPFYYTTVCISPDNPLNVWALAGGLFFSEDGGRNFHRSYGTTFGDHHAFWIDPGDPDYLIDGCDGGVSVSFDRGLKWDYINNIPMAQSYHVGFDMKMPYNVYSGFQDHEIWKGPSQRWAETGATGADWTRLRDMADGMNAFALPADNNIIIYNGHFGDITRLDIRNGQERFIQPYPIGPSGTSAGYEKYRFNWDSPILISPHDNETMYYGGNVLFRSSDRGESWEIISPDLTNNDSEKMKLSGGPITPDNTRAEYHCTIVSLAESPIIKGRIFVGTDDGNLHVTDDINFNADRIYISIDNHRRGDFNSYVYRSNDLGTTWQRITSGIDSYVHCIKEDSENPDLLFAGTERGVYVSLNGGTSWKTLNINMPPIPVMDIQIHPREGDLIIATHGRGLYILDDISWLRELKPIKANKPALFSIRDVYRYIPVSDRSTQGDRIYIAPNPSYGALISYFVTEEYSGENLLIEIGDRKGNKLWRINASSKPGIHRTSWNLGEDLALIDDHIDKDRYAGILKVPPGEYIISLRNNTTVIDKCTVNILQDPRLDIEDVRTISCYEYIHRLGKSMNYLNIVLDELDNTRAFVNKNYRKNKAASMLKRIDEINFKIVPEELSPNGLNILSRMNWLYNQVRKNSDEPTSAQKEWINYLIGESELVLREWKELSESLKK